MICNQSGNPAMSFVDGTFSADAPVVTPEPATLGLMLVGSAGLGWWRRRQQPTSDLRPPTSDLRFVTNDNTFLNKSVTARYHGKQSPELCIVMEVVS